MVKRATGFALLFGVLLDSSAAAAAKEDPPQAQMLQDLAACHQVAEASDRLVCLERASLRLLAAAKTRELVVMEGKEVETTRRSLFGFSLPKLPLFGGHGGDEEASISQIETTIVQARGLGHGKWAIRTAEGATWHTTEALVDQPVVGQPLTIRSAALGGYFMKIAKTKAVRAMRVN